MVSFSGIVTFPRSEPIQAAARAVDSEGYVVVGTLVNGGLTVVAPDGASVDHLPLPDFMVTNVCFGGDDLRTAYATCSATGTILSFAWPRPGLRLAY